MLRRGKVYRATRWWVPGVATEYTARMVPEPVIRSATNSSLRLVRSVRAGKAPGLVVLEGDRLIEDARQAGLGLDLVLVGERRSERGDAWKRAGLQVRVVQDSLLKRVSQLRTPPGTLAVCATPPSASLGDLRPEGEPLVLVIAGVSDPGNLGSLVRAAEAAGVSAVVVLEGGASPDNEKALRGSMGSLLRMPVVRESRPKKVLEELSARGFRHGTAATRGGIPPGRFDWSGPLALWIGSETGELFEGAEALEGITIPMAGRVESLNVSVAAAILLFAAGRNEVGSRSGGA